jgi:DNA-binding YbaB/EbfC family protein
MKQPMGGMLKNIAELQKRVNSAQKEISAMTFDGAAANGLVKVQTDGNGQVKRVSFDESLKGEDLETLGDLVVVALNDANTKKDAVAKKKLAGIAGGLMPFGMSVPGLG